MLRILAAILLFTGTAALAADPAIDTKQLDKSIAASLRDVHDRGADLYNQFKDYPGAYRLYEGGLLAVKPLLGHRTEVQKAIEDGLAAAGKEPDTARKAFLLHETIEKVRADLKAAAAPPKIEPKPEPKPMPMPPVKPKEPEPMPKPKEPAPPPKPKEPEPKPADKDAATIMGKVTVQGKALPAGTVTFVLQGGKEDKIATGVVKDGAFAVKNVVPGKYTVAVNGKPAASVPAKFGSEETSGLTYTVVAGANEFNIDLK